MDALSYAGEEEFRHSFEVHTHARAIEEIHVLCDCSEVEARQMLGSLLVEASTFEYDPSSRGPRFTLKR